MAARPRSPIVDDPDDEQGATLPPTLSPDDSPEDVALANIIADLGGLGSEARIHVYRVSPGTSNGKFCKAYSPLEFSLEALQAEYGPGDYKIHVRSNGRLAANRTVSIAETVAPKNTLPQLANFQSRQDDTAKLIETMQSGFAQMGQMFARTIETMMQMQPKPKTTMETLTEMKMMRDVFAPPQPSEAANPFQVLELASSLAEKITPRTGEVGNGEILLEAIKAFGPVLGQLGQGGPGGAPALMRNPAPPIHGAIPNEQMSFPEVPPEPQQTPENDPMFMAKMYLMQLIQHARAGHDPMTYAEAALDTVGEEQALAFIGRPDWADQLAALNKDVRDPVVLPWLSQVRDGILLLTREEESGIDGGELITPAPDAGHIPA